MSKEIIFEISKSNKECGYTIINQYTVIYKNKTYYFCKVNGSDLLTKIRHCNVKSILEFKESPDFNCYNLAYIIDYDGILNRNSHYDLGISYNIVDELKKEINTKVEELKENTNKGQQFYQAYLTIKAQNEIISAQINELYSQLKKLP